MPSSTTTTRTETKADGTTVITTTTTITTNTTTNAKMSGILLGIGNPILDISAKVSPDMLSKYDLKPNDAALVMPENADKLMPIYDDLVQNHDVEYIAGGATQNAIRVAQFMLKDKDSTSYVGCVGDDKNGRTLKEKASGDGVNVRYMIDAETPTGTCGVLITGDDRSLVANIAAANNYDPSHLSGETWDLVEKAQYYYIAGFFLTPPKGPEAIMKIAEHSAEKNKTFMMNLSAPFLCLVPPFFKAMMDAAPYWDILFGNESEMAEFSKANGFGTEDLKEIALKAAALPKKNGERSRTVVITHGSEPTIIAKDGQVTEYPVIPIAKEDIIDTNGAGDAFVGGFMSQLVQGKSIEECVRGGNWSANLIIQRGGCTYPEKCEF
jgi:adenosine kinase